MKIFISRLPFDWKTPLGYLATLSLEFIGAFYTAMFLVAIACFLVGSCWLLISFIEDITSDLSLLTENNETSDGTSDGTSDVIVRFYEIVQFYSDVEQLSGNLQHLKIII